MGNLGCYIKKITSLALIGLGIYQIITISFAVVFIYPKMTISHDRQSLFLMENLIEKAILYYLSLIVNSLFGIWLLFKPKNKVKPYQVITGAFLLFFSIFLLF